MNPVKMSLKIWLRLYWNYREDVFDLGAVIGNLHRAGELIPWRECQLCRIARRLAAKYAPRVETSQC